MFKAIIASNTKTAIKSTCRAGLSNYTKLTYSLPPRCWILISSSKIIPNASACPAGGKASRRVQGGVTERKQHSKLKTTCTNLTSQSHSSQAALCLKKLLEPCLIKCSILLSPGISQNAYLLFGD